MKTFVIENYDKSQLPESWFFLPDSALTNPGKPFFIPEMTDFIEARCGLALKIGRLGKTIAPRFAHRYFNEIALCVHFSAPTLQASLIEKGLSPDRARSFDRSLFLSESIPVEDCSIDDEVCFLKNGEIVGRLSLELSDEALGTAIAAVSGENTLKMGDIIIPAFSAGVVVTPGDIIELTKNNSPLLRIEIK